MPIATYLYLQVGQCVHVVTRGQVYDTQCSFTLSLCLCLLWPVCKPHFPRGHLSHFLHFSLWSCVLTLSNEYQDSIYIVPCEYECSFHSPQPLVVLDLSKPHLPQRLFALFPMELFTYFSWWNTTPQNNTYSMYGFEQILKHVNCGPWI